ncbi:MAG TPA: FHA domain-containing protein [Pyrinomonadaceae bacterium]|nr:FHA domain-containing protein [Pyrinomonadaceae bacterium]
MIACERCHTENLDGAQYCDECGAVLSVASAPPLPSPAQDGGGAAASASGVAGPQPAPPAPAFSPARTSLSSRQQQSLPRAAEGKSGALGGEGGPHAKLVIHRGRSVGKEFMLSDDESHIGRWDADGGIFPDVDLDADDPEAKVSRRHARITRRAGQYFIEDLGSTNGTFVNRGRRLLPGDRQQLRDGDEVIVGKTFLRFHVLGG